MSTEAAIAEYLRWLSSEAVSAEMKRELEKIKNSENEIKYRFSSMLEFGTAGLRGIMAAGTNCMNVHTVSGATQGFSDYINAEGGGSVVIGCDTRNNSSLFAKTAAEVLAGNGIRVYIFDSPRPTPELSFAIRYLGCIAGINITASHNPKEYNGYKAYWEDGAQLAPEQASRVSEYISKTDILNGISSTDYDDAVGCGMITVIGKEIDEKYMAKVLEQRVGNQAALPKTDMTIVYTPLHGTGYRIVPEVLHSAGFNNIITVPEQALPDGEFPTVKNPNPEYPAAFELGIGLAEKNNCDLIIATDPDADRVGIMVRGKDGFIALSGNQVGALLLDYIITALKEGSGIPKDAYAVKSIVTTELAGEICRANGVEMFNVLTGFKFIGEVIKKHEEAGRGTYLLGFEESYGYLKGTYARDKDAVVASLLICEMAAYYRSKGMTLYDAMTKLYEKYGYYSEKVVNITLQGAEAPAKMKAVMEKLRSNPPAELGGVKVTAVRDYLKGTITRIPDGKASQTGLPLSDVLYYETGNGAVVVRPSGTEPKIKLYFLMKAESREEVGLIIENCRKSLEALIK